MYTIKLGDKGTRIMAYQTSMIRLGFGKYLDDWGADGVFGPATERGTRAFQSWLNISVDGVVGAETYKKIQQAEDLAGINGTLNFKPIEFRCKGSNQLPLNGMDKKLIQKLEELRYKLNHHPIYILSGYRTTTHNQSVGGSKHSQHLLGKAADIRVSGISSERVYQKANDIFNPGGVGRYRNFTHVDTRVNRSRW